MIRDIFDVEVVESQRYFPIIGWGKKRMPTDRAEWTDREGSRVSKEQLEALMPGEGTMAWTTDWKLYHPPGEQFDTDGWQYALDFNCKYAPKSPADFVRRRIWRRSFLMTESDRSKRLLAIEANRPQGLDTVDFTFARNVTFAGKESLEKLPGGIIPPLGLCATCSAPFTIFSLKIECADCHKVCCGTCCRRCRVREEAAADDHSDDEGATSTSSPKSKEVKEKSAVYLCGQCEATFRKEHALQIQIKVRDRLHGLAAKEESRRSALTHELYDTYLADPVWASARSARAIAKNAEETRVKQELDERNSAKIQRFRSDDRKRAARVHLAVPCAMNLRDPSDRAEWLLRVVAVHDRDPAATNTVTLAKANESAGCGISVYGEWVLYAKDPILSFSATIDVKDDRLPIYVILQEKHSKSIGDTFSKLLSSKAPARFHHWADDKDAGAHVLGHAQVNLRDDIITKTSDVSETGVYLETCAVNCEIAAPDAAPIRVNPAAPTTPSKTASTMMVQWRLEVREVLREQSSVAFCDQCGKMKSLCSCA